jgi:acetoin:2,6-dichlorophenolindophenol oxidoreductase subunit alpha
MNDSERLVGLYRTMVRVRKINDFAQESLTKGRIRIFWHGSEGHEGSGVGAVSALASDDFLYYHYRGHGLPYLVPKGVDPKLILAEHYGRTTGICQSLSAFHTAAPESGVYGWSGLLGVQFGITLGFGHAARANGARQVAMCVFGEGSANKGQFHESLNMSKLWNLPIVWVCENNGYAGDTPVAEHLAAGSYVDQADAYGIRSLRVDGGDVEAVYAAATEAVSIAREGGGPTYLETAVFRPFAHLQGVHWVRQEHRADGLTVSDFARLDPIVRAREKLLAQHILTNEDVSAIDKEAAGEVAAIAEFCQYGPEPDPDGAVERLTNLMYKA